MYMLVWCEAFDRIEDAITFEKRLKKWNRKWKLRLIEESNPDWKDLYETLNAQFRSESFAPADAGALGPRLCGDDILDQTGSQMTARRPPSGLSSRRTSPPWARAMSRAIASPKPTPPA